MSTFTSNPTVFVISIRICKFPQWTCGWKGIWEKTNFDDFKRWQRNRKLFSTRLVKQNCSWGSGWCGSRSFNVQFNINLDTSAPAVRG